MSLSVMQQQFVMAVTHDEIDSELSAQLSNERRLFIYQNTIIGQLVEVLSSTYSAVKALVGDEYFTILAQAYAKLHPPKEASLTYYGEGFIGHLKQQDALQSMPYLFDLAHYEWTWNHVFFALDANYLDPSSLLGLDEESLEQLSFLTHPSLHLLEANYPVDTLWQWVEEGAKEPAPDIIKAPIKLIIWRNAQHDVMVERVVSEDWDIWNKIISRNTISVAFEGLTSVKQGEWLEKILTSSMVTSYNIEREMKND